MSLVIRFKRIISYPSHSAVVDAGIGGLCLMFTIVTRAFFFVVFLVTFCGLPIVSHLL